MDLVNIAISFCFIVLLYYYGFWDATVAQFANNYNTDKKTKLNTNTTIISIIYLINIGIVIYLSVKFDKYLLYPIFLGCIVAFEDSKTKPKSTKILAIVASVIGWLIFII